MARSRESRAARREAAPPRKGGSGLFTGLLLGLLIGLVVAAALAWYFSFGTEGFKPTAGARQAADPQPAVPAEPPAPTRPAAAQPKATAEPAAETKPRKPPHAPAPATAAPKPRIDYTFYGILPGDKPAKPVEPPKPTETWWLQIAALKNPADADKLKARLALLGLPVSTQRIDSAGQTLYRVRVGPYKREDDAFGDLDVLAENNYEPRLFKEPLKP